MYYTLKYVVILINLITLNFKSYKTCVFNFRLYMSIIVVTKVMIPLHHPRLLKKNGKKNDSQLLRSCQTSPVKYVGLLHS